MSGMLFLSVAFFVAILVFAGLAATHLSHFCGGESNALKSHET